MGAALAMKIEEEPMIGGMAEGRLEWHFDNWRRWMRKGEVTDGAPGRAAGCLGGGYSRTFDEMVDAADVRCAHIVDSLVSSLSHSERAAIYHRYLYAVFRLQQGNLEMSLARARTKVAEWLVARGVY